jgi:hypothetical protein
MKNPFRFWMTGGLAMLMAAFGGGVHASEDRLTLARVSPYTVNETVARIEASAQRHGLHVMARVPQKSGILQRDSGRFVIVLESTQGGTPVEMATADGQPDLLLSVVVRRGAGGHTEVLLPDGALHDLPDGMSDLLQHELAGLPGLVDEALA